MLYNNLALFHAVELFLAGIVVFFMALAFLFTLECELMS
ncbi:hypothetical protein QFZ80_005276 [Paenibacillus sp. V4I7]|nr:hypothetical protein [Paenibacillus sp. V4I7]MDQ0920050.1 hypothetical protein [Paenibacillus sp. V4I5]